MFNLEEELLNKMNEFIKENDSSKVEFTKEMFGCMDCSNYCAENCSKNCHKSVNKK